MPSRFAVALSCVLVCLSARLDAQWPQFRGPNGSGIGDGAGYPTEFSPTTNVAWKTAVPFGQSSPVIAGGRLYLTGIEGDELLTLAFDAGTGKALWRRALHRERKMEMYKANDPASPTPAADERGVVAFFADFGLVVYGTDGQVLWSHRMGPFQNFYGMSASPSSPTASSCSSSTSSAARTWSRSIARPARSGGKSIGRRTRSATPRRRFPPGPGPRRDRHDWHHAPRQLPPRNGRASLVDASRQRRLDGCRARAGRHALRLDGRQQRARPAAVGFGARAVRQGQGRPDLPGGIAAGQGARRTLRLD